MAAQNEDDPAVGTDTRGGEASGDVATPEEAAESVALSDEQAAAEDEFGDEGGRSSTDPWEDPHEGYYFLGAFYRHIIIPQFMLNLFLDEASGSDFPAFGIDLTYRKDGFDIVGSLWFMRAEGQGPMRASGDPVEDTEWVETDIWGVFLSGTFLWSTAFNDMFALEYGVGIGVGFITGDVYRWEAYPDSGGNYQRCNGPGNPDPRFCGPPPASFEGQQCSGGNEHYGCNEGKWSEGGDVPNVVPWFAIPHLALRIKPIKQMMIRVEGGFGLGFFAGFSAAYGF
ncbi:MAG: hypothetical protein JRH11_19590 [Deltaproteobacteria bacterium]|nr:hypothetical protein [Deltaproteobacteria bacterium]